MDQMSPLDRLTKGVRAYILLFCLTFFTALPGVFTMPALDRDESRFAQASKQMLETGDYIMIRYQDGQRNKKPAGIHWLQAGTTAIFSSPEAKQIWSYRLPSFIGGALATCALFWAGIPLIGRRAAFIGAALFGTGLLLTSEAHISKTDGVLVGITTLAVGALVYLRAEIGKPKPLAILFWFAMGFGFLIKGPITPMVAVMALAFTGLWEKRGWKWPAMLVLGLILIFIDTYFNFGPANDAIGWGIKVVGAGLLAYLAYTYTRDHWQYEWFRTLFWWPGPLLWVAMVLPWFLSIQIATDGQFVEGAVGKDLKDKVVGASEGHGGAPGYHILHIASHFFPATLFLIPGLVLAGRHIAQKADDNRGLIFIVAWALPTWIVFEFLPTKLSHYVLPAYPALALLCGYAVVKLMDGVRAPFSRAASIALFVLGAVVIALVSSPIAVDLFRAETAGDFKTADAETILAAWEAIPAYWWTLLPGVLAVLATFVLAAMKKQYFAVACALVSSLALGWHVRIAFLPNQTWVQPTTVARNALSEVCALPGQKECEFAPDEVHTLGYAEPSFVFTTGTDVKISPYSSSNLPPASEVPVKAFVVNVEDKRTGLELLDDIRAQARAQKRCFEESGSNFGLNYSNGSPVHFIAIKVTDQVCEP